MKNNHHHKRRGRRMCVIVSVLMLIILTGCWSSHEIEEQSLGVGLALDKAKESEIERKLDEQENMSDNKKMITSTYQIITSQVARSTNTQADPTQKSYMNVSETGNSIHEMVRNVSLENDTPIMSYHMKVIVISQKLASKYSLEKLLDQDLRDNDFRPSCLVLISNGRASNTLKSNVPGETPAFRLAGIVDNSYRTTKILAPVTLVKIESKLRTNASFLLQNVQAEKGKVKFGGAAIVDGKTKKVIGILDEQDLEGITWMTGKGKGGTVESVHKKGEELVVYEVISMKSKIKPHIKGGEISFDVKVSSKGRLSERWSKSDTASTKNVLKKVEILTEKEIEKKIKNSVEKMQGKYKVDIAGFGEQLRIHYPKTWDKVKDNWDEIFSGSSVRYKVDVEVEGYGTSTETKKG
jgi:spore germination protein